MGRIPSARALLSVLAASGMLLVSFSIPSAAEDGIVSLRPLVQPGERAPSFTLDRLDGRPFAFVSGDGTPTLLVFWSAFCPLCRELTPELVALSKRHGNSIRFLSVNLDGNRFRNAVRSFVEDHEIPFPVLLDDIRGDFFIASDPYGVSKTPTAVLVDSGGIVRGSYAAESMRDLIRNFDQVIDKARMKSTRLRHTANPDVFHVR